MSSTLKKSVLIYFLMLSLELIFLILVVKHAGWSLNPYLTGFDTLEYTAIAKNLVLNHVFSKSLTTPLIPNFFRSPGYPFWLALIYFIFESFKPAVFFGITIFSISAPLIYLIMHDIFSEKLALWTGLIFAIEPRMAFSAPFILSEQIFLPLFLLSVFFAISFLNYPDNKKYIYLSAIFLSLSTLVRGISLYLWPIFLIFFFVKLYKIKPLSNILKTLSFATVIFILIMLPWLIRNRLTLGTWQSSSLFGVQLYWGHLETLERYLGVPQDIAHQKNFDRAVKLTDGNLETPRAVDILTREALSEIKTNWLSYTNIYIFNLGLFFITDGYKGIASYVTSVKPNYINFGDFIIKLHFKEMFYYLSNFSFLDLILPVLGRILWIIITILSFCGIFICLKKIPQKRLFIILFSIMILYFGALTGPIFSPDPRFRIPVNGFIFVFALLTVFYIFKVNFRHELSN